MTTRMTWWVVEGGGRGGGASSAVRRLSLTIAVAVDDCRLPAVAAKQAAAGVIPQRPANQTVPTAAHAHSPTRACAGRGQTHQLGDSVGSVRCPTALDCHPFTNHKPPSGTHPCVGWSQTRHAA
ncbi:hypothetical protein LSTR_LSTR012719 [Laodelphax striatellus]|uniref:Uncharacterized protein n=1 Tax=Laodelphax striatellus TaxID=195883 RepID=A0A482WM64_LAOST|nr:hypothetical protein LSTR_LSTR012719 [Laodelphax striatellus]